MECSCTVNCYVDERDYEIWELFNTRNYKSSRVRDCDECKRSMAPGEPHEYICEINQETEEWHKHRTCESCCEIKDVFYEDYYYGRIWQELEEKILDEELQVSETCLTNLSPENRAKVCEFIEYAWKYMDDDETDLVFWECKACGHKNNGVVNKYVCYSCGYQRF